MKSNENFNMRSLKQFVKSMDSAKTQVLYGLKESKTTQSCILEEENKVRHKSLVTTNKYLYSPQERQ